MKVLAIQGSPRKNGNTAILLKHYLQGLEEGHSNAEIKLINLAEQNIQSCRFCDGCKTPKRKCVVKDDMQEIFTDILEADILILASPIFWWNITAQTKQFIDRFYALNFNNNFKGKKFVLLTTYGDEDPNSGPNIIKTMFSDICRYLGMDFIQFYGVCSGTVPVKDNLEAQNLVHQLGKTIVSREC